MFNLAFPLSTLSFASGHLIMPDHMRIQKVLVVGRPHILSTCAKEDLSSGPLRGLSPALESDHHICYLVTPENPGQALPSALCPA